VISLPRVFANKILLMVLSAFLAGLHGVAAVHAADTAREALPSQDDGAIPQPLRTDTFGALMASSPFTRSLGISESLILTGVARFDNHLVATLLDTQTMESQVVSQTPNQDGWQLIGIGGDPAKMQTWSAKIQIRGGEVISIRYQTPPPRRSRTPSGAPASGGGPGSGAPPPTLSTAQLAEAKNSAINYKEGFSGDGYPRQPPPEVVEKLSRLSVGQREDINRRMIGLFGQGVAQPERRRIYDDMVNRASQGRR
jgi:hypothetical protein